MVFTVYLPFSYVFLFCFCTFWGGGTEITCLLHGPQTEYTHIQSKMTASNSNSRITQFHERRDPHFLCAKKSKSTRFNMCWFMLVISTLPLPFLCPNIISSICVTLVRTRVVHPPTLPIKSSTLGNSSMTMLGKSTMVFMRLPWQTEQQGLARFLSSKPGRSSVSTRERGRRPSGKVCHQGDIAHRASALQGPHLRLEEMRWSNKLCLRTLTLLHSEAYPVHIDLSELRGMFVSRVFVQCWVPFLSL